MGSAKFLATASDMLGQDFFIFRVTYATGDVPLATNLPHMSKLPCLLRYITTVVKMSPKICI